jgi:hypothetical protein
MGEDPALIPMQQFRSQPSPPPHPTVGEEPALIDESELSPGEQAQLQTFTSMIAMMPTAAVRLMIAFLEKDLAERDDDG